MQKILKINYLTISQVYRFINKEENNKNNMLNLFPIFKVTMPLMQEKRFS